MTNELFERLMRINQEAFESRQFSVAYHVLAAALHSAQNTANEQQLLQVGQTATEQLAYIDLHHPDYEHSTRSAGTRGNHNIFLLLARQASNRERMAHLEHTQKKMPGIGTP